MQINESNCFFKIKLKYDFFFVFNEPKLENYVKVQTIC